MVKQAWNEISKEFKKEKKAGACLISNEYLPEEWQGMVPMEVYFEVNNVNDTPKICAKIIGKKGDEVKEFSFNMMSAKKDIEIIFPTIATSRFPKE